MKRVFSSQKIEMCLFLATTMAAISLRKHPFLFALRRNGCFRRLGCNDVTCKPPIPSGVTSYCVTMFSRFTSSALSVTGYCYCSFVTVEVREDKI